MDLGLRRWAMRLLIGKVAGRSFIGHDGLRLRLFLVCF
jgi:hypothetical protein